MRFILKEPFFLPDRACDLEVTLEENRTLVLMGENGIGKTSLLNNIRERVSPLEVTYLSQKPLDIFYDRTLRQLKEVFVSAAKGTIDEDRFQTLWRDFGMVEKEDRLLSQLSGGEAQSLKITLALSKRCPLLVADEPSHYLDEFRRRLLHQVIAKFHPYRLIVEHDVSWFPPGTEIWRLEFTGSVLRKGSSWTTS